MQKNGVRLCRPKKRPFLLDQNMYVGVRHVHSIRATGAQLEKWTHPQVSFFNVPFLTEQLQNYIKVAFPFLSPSLERNIWYLVCAQGYVIRKLPPSFSSLTRITLALPTSLTFFPQSLKLILHLVISLVYHFLKFYVYFKL